MPVERGRTLLALGAVQRRLKQRSAARKTLADALGLFEQARGAGCGRPRARAEQARVSGRAPGPGGLTETEQRVAELVAQGLSNRQVAAELFVTVRAVESTLTKAYAKLGVRSRTQLASLLRVSPVTGHKVWISAFTPEPGRPRLRSCATSPSSTSRAETQPGRPGQARPRERRAGQPHRSRRPLRRRDPCAQDESCFAIYDADSPAAITAAGSLAGIAFDRIVEVAIDDASDATGQVG